MRHRHPEPQIIRGEWHERLADGSVRRMRLNAEQLDADHKLQHAGQRKLLTFLSGQGGTGKSTLIRLLTAYWRSQGLRVLLTASSGKAARLIGGLTVHSAFKLHQSGIFLHCLGARRSAGIAPLRQAGDVRHHRDR
jgi:putative protein kinase ArgK-like GTPase of G3E family